MYDRLPAEAVGFVQTDSRVNSYPELTELLSASPVRMNLDDASSTDGARRRLERALANIVVRDKHTERQRAALRTFVALADELGEPTPELDAAVVTALDDPDPPVRQKAAWTVGRIADDYPASMTESIDCLTRVLADDHYTVRAYGVDAVGRIGCEHPALVGDAVDGLPAAVDDDYTKVRRNAVWAIGKVGRHDPDLVADMVPGLLDSLDDAVVVRQTAVWALGLVGGASPGLVTDASPDLISRLSDQSPDVRRNAAGALGRLGRNDPGAVTDARNPLQEVITDEGELLTVRAMSAIAYLHVTTDAADHHSAAICEPIRSLLASDYCPSTFLELLAARAANHPSFVAQFSDELRAHRDHDEPHARSAVRSAISTVEGTD